MNLYSTSLDLFKKSPETPSQSLSFSSSSNAAILRWPLLNFGEIERLNFNLVQNRPELQLFYNQTSPLLLILIVK